MLKLSKKIEYAILALQFLSDRDGQRVSAKEISTELEISFEFLSKTLQVLIRKGLVESQKGVKGGYMLTCSPSELSLIDVIQALDSNSGLVNCTDSSSDGNCEREDFCTLRGPIQKIQKQINTLFQNTTFEDLKSDVRTEKQRKIYNVEMNIKELKNA